MANTSATSGRPVSDYLRMGRVGIERVVGEAMLDLARLGDLLAIRQLVDEAATEVVRHHVTERQASWSEVAEAASSATYVRGADGELVTQPLTRQGAMARWSGVESGRPRGGQRAEQR